MYIQRVLSEEVVGNPEDNLDSDDAWGGTATPDSSDDDEDGGSGKGGGNTGFVYGQSSTVGRLNNFSFEENYDIIMPPMIMAIEVLDAYFGLLKTGPNGGVAQTLATSAEGFPFRFLNGVDIDQETGMVYFTDTSAI
ncbi:hypothetical protein ACLB2K_073640 [Fragaria x ananassa]